MRSALSVPRPVPLMPARELSSRLARARPAASPRISSTSSGPAFSGEPASNGGAGSYSIPSWIAFATSSLSLARRASAPCRSRRRPRRRSSPCRPRRRALRPGSAPKLAQRIAIGPVSRRPLAFEDPGGAEHERAGADGGRPVGRLVGVAEPVERPRSSSSSGRLPSPPGTSTTSGSGRPRSRVAIGVIPRLPVSVRFGPASVGDEGQLGPGHAREHLVGPDRVEGGELVETSQGIVSDIFT